MAANAELKKIVGKIKTAQKQFQGLVKDKTWLEDARKYAESQGREIKKLVSGDVDKVKTFLNREKKQLERFQKQIPGEIKKFKDFVNDQKKELEKLLTSVKKSGSPRVRRTAKTGARKPKKASAASSAPNSSESVSSKSND